MFHGLGFRVDDLWFRIDVNQKIINVLYLSLKMMIKIVSVNMKSGDLIFIFNGDGLFEKSKHDPFI